MSIPGLTLCLLLRALPYIICNIAVYAGDTSLYAKCDQASARSNNCGDIDIKMSGSLLDGISSLKMLGLSLSSKLD